MNVLWTLTGIAFFGTSAVSLAHHCLPKVANAPRECTVACALGSVTLSGLRDGHFGVQLTFESLLWR